MMREITWTDFEDYLMPRATWAKERVLGRAFPTVARYPLVEIGDSKTGIRFLLWDGIRVGRNGSPR